MKVLVATDGSDNAMKALKKALEMAENEKAEVILMAVAYYSKDYFDDMPRASRKSWRTMPNKP